MIRRCVDLMNGLHAAGLLARWAHPGDAILDIGCGVGALGYILETERGYSSVYNIDIADIRRFPLRRYQICDSLALPFDDASFDMTVLAFVLHHMPDRTMLGVIKEAMRVTRGHVLILEDTPEVFFDRILAWLHGWTWRIKHRSAADFSFHTAAEWQAIFAEQGLEVLVAQRLSRVERCSMPCARTCFLLRAARSPTTSP